MSRRECPACAGHGVVSGVRMVEVKPGIYKEIRGDRPCMLCHPPTAVPNRSEERITS